MVHRFDDVKFFSTSVELTNLLRSGETHIRDFCTVCQSIWDSLVSNTSLTDQSVSGQFSTHTYQEQRVRLYRVFHWERRILILWLFFIVCWPTRFCPSTYILCEKSGVSKWKFFIKITQGYALHNCLWNYRSPRHCVVILHVRTFFFFDFLFKASFTIKL